MNFEELSAGNEDLKQLLRDVLDGLGLNEEADLCLAISKRWGDNCTGEVLMAKLIEIAPCGEDEVNFLELINNFNNWLSQAGNRKRPTWA